jgi:hypothetical protein
MTAIYTQEEYDTMYRYFQELYVKVLETVKPKNFDEFEAMYMLLYEYDLHEIEIDLSDWYFDYIQRCIDYNGSGLAVQYLESVVEKRLQGREDARCEDILDDLIYTGQGLLYN